MKKEIAIMPNPNQLIVLRSLQKKLCVTLNAHAAHASVRCYAVSALPLCVHSDALSDFGMTITSAEPKALIRTQKEIMLEIALRINGNDCRGFIKLCRFEGIAEKNANLLTESTVLETIRSVEDEIAQKLKKISPFRLVRLETEESENGSAWRITKEKWIKLKTFPAFSE